MVVNELRGEKVDIVPYSDDPAEFVMKALAPARVREVRIHPETGTAEVIVPDFQLSLAIGKEGQNARLAARLTGWRVDIKSESQLAEEESGGGVEYAEGEWVTNDSGELVWQPAEGGEAISAAEAGYAAPEGPATAAPDAPDDADAPDAPDDAAPDDAGGGRARWRSGASGRSGGGGGCTRRRRAPVPRRPAKRRQVRRSAPRRTCVGCRRTAPAAELVRLRWTPLGLEVGRGPGRGAWLCGSDPVACLDRVARRPALARALRAPVHRRRHGLRRHWRRDRARA